MSDNTVTIEIDGVPVEARAGQMLIEVTDREDAYVPRFCYHRKLSVAANCRMCLVEVERAPKPLPACATPVMDGMKVFTRSSAAISAQKATMEFLLINHPLDCPICDQGGECELQDLAMGYGRGVSRYTEKKRVVKDKNLGPLVSTDMTRCIHCTRCVRFGDEIAGIQELGATGRSEDMEIGTWIERSVDHELSGNIIDLCPVGALNNKPYRYSARAWEMVARPLVSPHDCAGSNLYGHVLRGRLKRVVPRDNDAINETWISDRDRFSYEGVYTEDRLTLPRVYGTRGWSDIGWPLALEEAAETLRDAAKQGGGGLGFLVSPNATVEEMYLLNRIARHLGSNHIDYRLRTRDFRDQEADPLWPALGTPIAGIDDLDGVLVVGSNLRREVPIIAHRIRNAALGGAAVGFVNPSEYEYHFRYDVCVEAPLPNLAGSLAGVLAAAHELLGRAPDGEWASLLGSARPGEPERAAAQVLLDKHAKPVAARPDRHAASPLRRHPRHRGRAVPGHRRRPGLPSRGRQRRGRRAGGCLAPPRSRRAAGGDPRAQRRGDARRAAPRLCAVRTRAGARSFRRLAGTGCARRPPTRSSVSRPMRAMPWSGSPTSCCPSPPSPRRREPTSMWKAPGRASRRRPMRSARLAKAGASCGCSATTWNCRVASTVRLRTFEAELAGSIGRLQRRHGIRGRLRARLRAGGLRRSRARHPHLLCGRTRSAGTGAAADCGGAGNGSVARIRRPRGKRRRRGIRRPCRNRQAAGETATTAADAR